LAEELLESAFAIIVTRQPSSIKVQLATWDIIFTLGDVGRRIQSLQEVQWRTALKGGHARRWSQPRPLFVRNAKPTFVSRKRSWMFAGI
jgi:hypothetical protein